MLTLALLVASAPGFYQIATEISAVCQVQMPMVVQDVLARGQCRRWLYPSSLRDVS